MPGGMGMVATLVATLVEREVHNDCKALVDSPDQPVCDGCVENGHFDNPNRVPFDEVLEQRRAERS